MKPLAILTALLVIGGCQAAAAPTPQIIYVTPAPTTAAAASSGPTPSPTPASAPTLLPIPSASSALASPHASPTGATSYWSASKLAEGGHGGPPLLDLPTAIAIDYRVSGSCVFSLGLATATSAVGLPSLSMTVTGPELAGTWRLSIKPGSYYPVVGEAVGCVYSVNVRDDR